MTLGVSEDRACPPCRERGWNQGLQDAESEAIEALLAADWHRDQCGCTAWPEGCVGLERPVPPFTWTVDAVLAAQARLRRAARPAAEKHGVTEVYELLSGGRTRWGRVGVFSTVELAKKVAALVLDTYHEFDGDEGTEPVDYDAEWVMRRETIGLSGRHEVGDPKPFLRYGADGSAFKIATIAVDTASTTSGVVYPPDLEH